MITLPENEKQALIDQIIIWIFDEAKSKADTMRLIQETAPQLTEDDAAELMVLAFEKVGEIQSHENTPVETIKLHITYYERIYTYFKSIDHAVGMNKALQAKEKLLNILKDSSKVVLQKTETVIREYSPTVEYDLSKLTPQEQERLKYLVEKASA